MRNCIMKAHLTNEAGEDQTPQNDWLEAIGRQVKSLRFGVVQVTVHDSRVVQIEKTERIRFESPAPAR